MSEQSRQAGATLGRHTLVYLLGRVGTGGVGLLTLVVFTRVLTPADYGRYAVLVAVASLISAGGFEWLRQCLVRFGTGTGTDASRQPLLGTLGAVFAILLLATAAIAILALFLADAERLPFHVDALEICAICVLAWATAWFELTADARRAALAPWRYSVAIFSRAAFCLSAGAGVAMLTHDAVHVVMGVAMGYLLASLLAMPRWLRGFFIIGHARWREARRLLRYGLPLCLTLSLSLVLSTVDRLMLAGMRDITEAGVYASAYNLAQFSLGTVLSGLALGSLPLAVGAFRGNDRQAVQNLLQRNLLFGFALALPAMVGLCLLAAALGRLLLGNYQVNTSALVIGIVAVGTGLSALRSYCVDVVFLLEQRTWLQSLVVGGAALLNVMLNYWWIPTWGAVGAAVATLVSYAAAYVGSSLLSRRYMRVHVDIRQLAGVLLACIVMAIPVWWLGGADAGLLRVSVAIGVGGTVYAALVYAFDLAEIRTLISARMSA